MKPSLAALGVIISVEPCVLKYALIGFLEDIATWGHINNYNLLQRLFAFRRKKASNDLSVAVIITEYYSAACSCTSYDSMPPLAFVTI